tara:strand:+ start:770 stop:1402 length:633 start_codon:yes stop_codon:yes gene_type:complete
MNRQDKAQFIIKTLNYFFPNPAIPLSHKDNYTLLIAVLLSARCTDERVNKVTPALFHLADNPFSMMSCRLSDIEDIIRPCGLAPFKSRSIKDLSKIIVQKYNGRVPDNFKELEELPGVGHKTASVLMTQAFNIPAFPVDTHIHRLSFRWGISNGKNVKITEEACKSMFPKNIWGKLHLQMIFFGRKFCPARTHIRKSCPICSIIGRKSLI